MYKRKLLYTVAHWPRFPEKVVLPLSSSIITNRRKTAKHLCFSYPTYTVYINIPTQVSDENNDWIGKKEKK